MSNAYTARAGRRGFAEDLRMVLELLNAEMEGRSLVTKFYKAVSVAMLFTILNSNLCFATKKKRERARRAEAKAALVQNRRINPEPSLHQQIASMGFENSGQLRTEAPLDNSSLVPRSFSFPRGLCAKLTVAMALCAIYSGLEMGERQYGEAHSIREWRNPLSSDSFVSSRSDFGNQVSVQPGLSSKSSSAFQ